MLGTTGAAAPACDRDRRPTARARIALAALALLLGGPVQAAVILSASLTGPASYTPGGSAGSYTLTIGNTGSDADTPAVTTSFPAGVTAGAWSCSATGAGTSCNGASGSGALNRAPTLATNGQVVYTFAATYASSLTIDPLIVSALVDPAASGESNLSRGASSTRDQDSDLSVVKTAPSTLHFPGGGSLYRIVVQNAGPSDAQGIVVTDNEPTGVTFTGWNCTRAPSGSCTDPANGDLSQTITIPAGFTYTYDVIASFALNVPASVTNTATLTVPAGVDATTADHTDSVTTGRNPQSDLTLAFTPGGAGLQYTPGVQDSPLSLRITNTGGTVATAPVAMNFPAAAITGVSWSCLPQPACTPSSGTGNFSTTVTVPATPGSNVVDVLFLIDYDSGSLVTPLVLETVLDVDSRSSGPDPVPDNNDKRASNSYAIHRQADLEIEKRSSSVSGSVAPGAGFSYDLIVRNKGPSDIGNGVGETGLTISDTFPLQLRGDAQFCGGAPDTPCWTYCPDDEGTVGNYLPTAASCPAPLVSGSGNVVAQPVRLRANSSTILRAFVSTGPTATGSISNTATLSPTTSNPAVTELVPGNNSSTAVVSAAATTDIAVTKTDGLASVTAGSPVTYTIAVRNNGFNTAAGVTVTDTLPLYTTPSSTGLVPGSISIQCRAFNNACCTTNGSANACGTNGPTPAVFADVLNATVDLPGQARVEFTVTGTVDPRSSTANDLVNVASAAPPAGLPDETPGNDSAEDRTTVVNQAGLSIQKRLLSLAENGAHQDLTYEIIVANAGPSRAGAATVSDPLGSPLLVAANAAWSCAVIDNPGSTSCGAASGTGPLSTTVALDAGGRVRYEVLVPTIDGARDPVSNTATITEGANTATVTVVSPLAGAGDLQITKTDFIDAPDAVVPGTENEYVITVRNVGDDDAFGARIVDLLPPEFENASWTCAATTPVPGDLTFLMQEGGSTGGRAVIASGDGRHIYVASNAGKAVSAYDRVAVPGLGFGNVALLETEIEATNDAQDIGTTVSGLHAPVDLALTPDGSMLFVLSRRFDATTPSMISAFNRVTNPADPAYGKLSFAGSVAAGVPGDAPVQIEASNGFVYVSGVADGTPGIAVFKRAASTGLPALDATQTSGVPAAVGPLAISIGQARLFAASTAAGGFASFSIADGTGPTPAGRLASLATFSDAELTGMTDLVVAPVGQHLYAMATTSERVGVLSYANANSLTKSFAYSASGLGVTASAGATFSLDARLALAPDGEHVLVAQGGGAGVTAGVVQLRRDRNGGGLTRDTDLFAPAALALGTASDIEISPDGRHVFFALGTSPKQLTVYARRAPDPVFGFLEVDSENPAPEIASGLVSPADVAISGDGHHVYSVSLGDGALVAFRRDARRGPDDPGGQHLTPLATYFEGQGGVSGLARATRVLVSPDRLSVYVSSEDNNTVAVFDRNDNAASPDFGRLTFVQLLKDGVGGVDGLLGAQGMAMDASSSQLYVAGSFESAVATFRRNPNRSLTYLGVVKGGSGGATGMGGMRDLVVTSDGRHVMGVGSFSNAVVVLTRETSVASPNFGSLTFLQSRTTTGVKLMAIAIPSTSVNPDDNEHVYVVGQDDDSVIVLRRVVDPASSAFGTLSTLHEYRGVGGLDGPRDIAVSPDGRRVFAASQFGHNLVVFDRDLNRASTQYGGLEALETRIDEADGVQGLNNVYALAVSADSRNVYAAGFGDRAIASFAVGSGSYCSAMGSGDVTDTVNIGAGGTVEYRLRVFVRPDATGILSNTAEVIPPDRFDDPDLGNNTATDTSVLGPQGDLSISKSNGQISVIAGSTVRYDVVVDNPGPSNLVHSPATPVTVSDLLDSNPGFVPGSARWTCLASGSGALDFEAATFDGDPGATRLGGVTDLVRIADRDGAGPLPGLLAAASVLEDAVTLFERDEADGRLTPVDTAFQGGTLLGTPIDSLAGARALAASTDGRFLYVASRVSDAITVLRIEDNGSGVPRFALADVERNRVGLDQASHLVLSPAQDFLYVAGANDDAIAVFRRDTADGTLTWIESEQNGVDDATDAGAAVAGLDGVEFLVASPDGAHLYALASSAGSIARFDIDALTGRLSWREVRDGDDFAIGMDGVSGAVFDYSGERLYVAAADDNRIVVLGRRIVPSAGNYGELRLLSSVTQESGGTLGLLSPRRVALTGDGGHLYVTAQGGSSVAWFGRDPLDGSLRFLGLRSSESGGVDGMQGATGLAIDDTRNQVYVAGTLQSAVVQFSRQADSSCPPSGTGELDDVPVNIAAGGRVTFSIDVDVVSTLTGALTNTASVNSAFDPDSSDNSVDDVDQPSLVADLSITKDDGLAAFDGVAGARALVGDGRHLYVAGSTDNAIGHFVRNDDPGHAGYGALQFADVTRAGSNGVLGLAAVADLVLSADGAHLYAASPTDNSVATFARDAGTGALAYLEIQRNGVSGVTGLSGARALALSPDGRHAYVVSEFANAIAVFARDATAASANFGKLTFAGTLQHGIGGVDGLQQPLAVAVSPDGAHVYTLGGGGSTLAVFRRNPNSGSASFGQLTYVTRYAGAPGGASGLESARALAFDTAGTGLYVLGGTPGTLAQFTRTPASGELALTTRLVQGTGGVIGLAGAQRLRLAPNGTQLYVAGGTDNSVSHFTLGAGGVPAFTGRIVNGDPVTAGGQVTGLAGARDVLVAPDGAHVYAASFTDAALTGFDRAPTGDLAWRETFFDGLGGVPPGEIVTYRIVVSNAGPAAVTQASVVDLFPAQFVSASWTCVDQTGGGQCLPSGTGNLDTVVDLPAGAAVVFEAVGVLGDSVGGTLVNTASVAAAGVTDPDASNNQATDGNTVLSPALDLVASIPAVGGSQVPGGDIDYSVRIRNLGPTYASQARVSDVLPPALRDVSWTCSALPVAGLLAPVQALGQPAGSTVSDFTSMVPGALGLHLYATAHLDGTGAVLVYARDPLDGHLTLLQTLRNGVGGVSGIAGASQAVLSGDERFVYVAGPQSDAVALFARDAGTGELTYVTRYQDGELGIDGLGGVRRLLLAPGGTHLYAAGTVDDAIAVFAVNAGTGQLSASSIVRQSQPGMDGLNGVLDLAWSAGNSHLIAIAGDNQSIAAFARNPATGALTRTALLQEFELGSGVLASPVTLESNGQRVLVASANGRVGQLGFDPAAATPAFVAQGNRIDLAAAPDDLHFDTDQARLYIASAASSQLHVYSLLDTAPALLASYAAPQARTLARSPDARQLYSGGSFAATWARDRGSRCPTTGSGGIGEQSVDIAPGGRVDFAVHGTLFANATGNLVYDVAVEARDAGSETNPADNTARHVLALAPAPQLTASKSDGLAQVVAGTSVTWGIGVDNDGISAAVQARVIDNAPVFPANNAGLRAGSGFWTCSVEPALAQAELRSSPGEAALLGIGDIAVTADGLLAYGVNATRDALIVFARLPDGSLGTLREIRDGDVLGAATVSGLDGASAVAVSADGKTVLVTGALSNTLVVFSHDGAGGYGFVQKFTSNVDGVAGLLGAEDVAIAAGDRNVYVAAPAADAIAQFRRDPATGRLVFVERIRDGFGTFGLESEVIRRVARLSTSDDGKNLYAISRGQNGAQAETVSSFAIDGSTGTLSYLNVLRRSAVAGLAGVRDLTAAPGDAQLYVLGDAAIVRLDRQPDGRLVFTSATTGTPGLDQPRALVADEEGSRIYLVNGGGAIAVYSRDWSSGAIAYRQSVAAVLPPVPTGAANAVHGAARGELLVSLADGRVLRYDERPLSFCGVAGATSDSVDALVDLDVDGHAGLAYAGIVHPSARGTLVNSVTINPAAGSAPTALPASAQDSTTIIAVSDLSVEKTGPARIVAGTDIEYRLRVRNAGPSDALGMRVVDTLSPRLQNVAWTCAATGTSSCPASGATTLDATSTLKVGEELVFVVSARVDSSFIGTLPNRVDLVPEPGATDPTTADHVATTSTDVVAEADVVVSKDDGVARVVAGTSTTYRIVITNAGPSDVPLLAVRDPAPAGVSSVAWSCVAGGSATCPPIGGSGVNFDRVLPAGGSWIIDAVADVDPAARGTLTNTVSVQLPGTVLELDPSDNSATDVDTIDVSVDLAVTLVDEFDPFDPAGSSTLPYRVDVTNNGPSTATGVVLAVDFGRNVTIPAPADCIYTGQRMDCQIAELQVGASTGYTLQLSSLPAAPAQITAIALVTSGDPDPVIGNNSATQTTELRSGGDVNVVVRRTFPLVGGEATSYAIDVSNIGSTRVSNIAFNVTVPVELVGVTWTCSASSGADCAPSGSGPITATLSLDRFQSVRYVLNATVDPALDPLVPRFVQLSADAQVAAGTDINLANNSDFDRSLVVWGIFRDGFEDAVAAIRKFQEQDQ